MKNSTTMYILCSNISPNNAISGFRFVTEDNIKNINRTVVRVELPDDVSAQTANGGNHDIAEPKNIERVRSLLNAECLQFFKALHLNSYPTG